MVEFESLIERDVILLLEFSPGVLSYREQPERVFYSDGDSIREYYPDFEVQLASGRRLHIEAKPVDRLAQPSVARKLELIGNHYAQYRTELFQIITDQEARTEPLHSNLALLGPLRARLKVSGMPPTVTTPTMSWAVREAAMGRHILLKSIAAGVLVCDLTKPLSGELPVYPAHEAHHDALYI